MFATLCISEVLRPEMPIYLNCDASYLWDICMKSQNVRYNVEIKPGRIYFSHLFCYSLWALSSNLYFVYFQCEMCTLCIFSHFLLSAEISSLFI